ncbi:MAG: DinB family protein [bacterium]
MIEEQIIKLRDTIHRVITYAEVIPPSLRTLKPDQIAFSVNEIIYHLLEVEELWQRRIHLMLHEDEPHFERIDPDELAKTNKYNEQDFHQGIADWKASRNETIELVEALNEKDLARIGMHSKFGEIDTYRILDIMADHDLQHLRQMERTILSVKK